MNALDFLNENSGAFAVIFSSVVAIATAIYAILTWRLVSETRKLREIQSNPKLSITIKPREEWISLIDMIIINIGAGPALEIRFTLKEDFEYRKNKFLSQLNLIKNGLDYLAPKQKVQFFLTSMIEKFQDKIEKPILIQVTYKNAQGNQFFEEFIIDFSTLVGLSQLGEPSINKIAKNVEEIQKDIHKIGSGWNRMKVIAYTKEDIDKENEEYLKEAEEYRKEREEKNQ